MKGGDDDVEFTPLSRVVDGDGLGAVVGELVAQYNTTSFSSLFHNMSVALKTRKVTLPHTCLTSPHPHTCLTSHPHIVFSL
jgi:hypothetical protein